jgi:hypothetical protein
VGKLKESQEGMVGLDSTRYRFCLLQQWAYAGDARMSLIRFKRYSNLPGSEFLDFIRCEAIDNLRLYPNQWEDDKATHWVLQVQIGQLSLSEVYNDYDEALGEFERIIRLVNKDQ